MAKYLKLGASGVQMATRFVATEECDASIEFKKLMLMLKKEDVTIVKKSCWNARKSFYLIHL